MGAQNGKDLLVKVDMNGTGLFETIAGLRATRISFNAESVDVTSLESQGGWRELLSGGGGQVGLDFRIGRVQGRRHG
ncbi:Phage major tail protein 2 [Ruegeria arenilitoris]|uniref:Phage major tail protein 2 n=1 Tax=Ruegeria arenilitoris TaxID=1173585 RepID=A0A238JXB9_9RHOB|nr:Phage major tail protein 2 [Ruegeria arenilitoris]